ncbi:poly(A) polymerase [Streptomyces sp. NBC_00102]|uniref:poly(A) polymerase n=1 Tax=Streptomyces sp. NBC_00102 TaxID=2975652 RepID=UPI002256DC05|nr:poly(A) polymerase [Streptomyces sp. NBC_00102]MCX5397536.1 RNA repair domain-containing protein [Streptomyces sp. NBC_00102]
MRTSDEIYHRIRWDARFDPARFTIGVAQRGREPKRVPLPRFTPGGDVPWHRVLFFEADGETVWDRASGLDRVDTAEAGRVRETRLLPSPYFAARVPHAFDGRDWAPAPVNSSTHCAGLTVLTWNTLWDRYDSERIDTARRRPLLLDALRAADADVIALQEVEPPLLDLLAGSAWVREEYAFGGALDRREVADCGLLLLSRLPVREAGWHPLGRHKAVAAVVVETADGPVTVAVTHLSSDHSPEGAARRDRELADLATGLAELPGELLVVGDFNDGGPNPQSRLGLPDAWTAVHGPHDHTPTFDPSVNPLAAVGSLTGRVSRLDRVLYRAQRLRPVTARLVGAAPDPTGLYASDHFGVRVALSAPDGPGNEEPTDGPGNEEPADGPGAEYASGAGESVLARVARALPGASVHLVGSRRTGGALPGADVDLVAAVPAPVGARALGRVLPDAEEVREVVGARVPGLRFRLEGLPVDLVTVDLSAAGPARVPPAEAVGRRGELGRAAAVALSAVSDAEELLAATAPYRAAFTGLVHDVKAWARARGLDSAPCGGLPGLAWTVLAARTATGAGTRTTRTALLRNFFAQWAAWDWDRPVAYADTPASPCPGADAAVTILTPTTPVRSCSAQVSRAGRDRIAEELFLAWEVLEAAADTAPVPYALLCAPPPLHLRHAAWALVSVREGGDEGRFRGRLLAFLDALARSGSPDTHAWPRPVNRDAGFVRYAVGLGATPPEARRLTEIGTEILRGLPGARVNRVAEVPDLS